MLKFIGCFLSWIVVVNEIDRADMVLPLALGSLVLFYVVPGFATKAWAYFARRRIARQEERDDIARANAAEFEYSTALRREIDRKRALDDQQLAAMAATLDLQAAAEERKARKLEEALAAAAKRRDADIATLLERLEVLKSEAKK